MKKENIQIDNRLFYRKMISLSLPIIVQSLMLALVAAGDALMLGRIDPWRICLPLAGTGGILLYLPGRSREDPMGYDSLPEVQVGAGSDKTFFDGLLLRKPAHSATS